MKQILFIGLALAVTSCTQSEKIIEKHFSDDKPAQKIEVQEDMDSEQMALAGEQLISTWNFMLADKVFNWSLTKDPNNKRAQFYSALLKPFMLTKGLGVRLRPYLRNNGGTEGLENNLKNLPESPLKAFLMDGTEDINNTKDIQKLLVQTRDAWNDFRKFLIANQSMSIVLNMNPSTFQDQISKNISSGCKIEENTERNVVVNCDYAHAFQKKVNAADLLALRQMAASYVLYLSIYTSYSLDGFDALAKIDNGNMTEQERNDYFEHRMPGAGQLRKDNNLSLIPNLGSDFLAAARWVVQYQQNLCPQRTSIGNNKRPGHLVDGSSFCVENVSKAEKDLQMLEATLRGPIEFVMPTKKGLKKSSQVDYMALFNKPVEDLRSLLPSSYNSCGKAVTLRDKTVGGLFPLADAEEFMIENCR